MKCPECGDEMVQGFVNASGMGIVWKRQEGFWLIGRSTERLQKDWWGFPKLSKKSLPAMRCEKCKVVYFRYSKET